MVRRPCSDDWCGPCRHGRQDFCITGDFTERGIKGEHGYMTEFVVDDEQYMVKVPRESCARWPSCWSRSRWPRRLRSRRASWWAGCPAISRTIPATSTPSFSAPGPIGLLGAMKLMDGGFNTWVYSMDPADSPNVKIVTAIGARFISAAEHPATDLAKIVGNISLMYEATGIAKVAFDALSVLGVNGVFISTGVPAAGRTRRDRRRTDHAQPRAQQPTDVRHRERRSRLLRGGTAGPGSRSCSASPTPFAP